MPGLAQLIIDDDTGTEKLRLEALTASDQRSLVELWSAQATVDRDAWLSVRDQLDPVTDRVRIERADGSTLFAGRFRNDERDGQTVVVTIDSYERDAIDAQPTDGLEVFQNVADSAVVTDALGDIPTLSAGTIETGASAVSFTFAHAERSKQIRDAAGPAGMDVAYRPDRTVDFLTRLGSDKSGSITVSNTDQTIVNDLTISEDSRDPVTHIRGLGAQRGETQVTAEAVVDSYTAGDRQVWREFPNSDIVQQDRLQEIVNRLADEYDDTPRRLTIEADLVGVDVSLGDSLRVAIPEQGIDDTLRIIQYSERVSAAPATSVTLTNRTPERAGARKRRDDLERFNKGWQGYVDRDTDAFGWQPVTASTMATRPYPYPDDVEAELTAEAIVTSVPYRAYSSGSASGGDHIHGVTATSAADNTGEYSEPGVIRIPQGTILPNGAATTARVPQSPTGGFSGCAMTVSVYNQTGSSQTYDRVIDNRTTGVTLINDSLTVGDGVIATDNFSFDSSVTAGDVIDYQLLSGDVGTDSGKDFLGGFGINISSLSSHDHEVSDTTSASGPHTHDPEPGLIEFSGETASGVDLRVNGSTVATDIGSGEFTATVDIAGELTPGANTIEATSDSLGLVNLLVNTELFRRGQP